MKQETTKFLYTLRIANKLKDNKLKIACNLHQVKVIASYCSGSGSMAEEGNYRYWIRLPQTNTWQKHSSGLSYYLSNLSWTLAGTNNNNNQVYVGPNYYAKQSPSGCHSVGTVWGLGSAVLPLDRSMSLTVAVSRATAYPGSYNLNIPFAWAYEENKG